jgi:hypothetical protein
MNVRGTAFGQRFPARRLIPFLALLLAFLLWPSPASADAGTAFMWNMVYFQFYGPAFLGILEGILIALVFRARVTVALGVMVLANYASTFVGVMLLSRQYSFVFGSLMRGAPLYDMPRLHWILLGISFVITLLVEWPFCLLVLWRKRGRWWKSVLANGLAQTASYALLVPLFFHMSEWRLYREVAVDPAFVPTVSDDAVVYFLSADGREVYRVGLNGRNREKVMVLGAKERDATLFVRRADDGKHVDLCWAAEGFVEFYSPEYASQEPPSGYGGVLLAKVGVLPFPNDYDDNNLEQWDYAPRASVLDFRSSGDRAWEVQVGSWGDRLISAKNATTGKSLRLSFETPFVEWVARHVSVIPGGKVVLELCTPPVFFAFVPTVHLPDEIVLLDLRSRKLGLITYGRSPVVVFPEQSAPASGAGKTE